MRGRLGLKAHYLFVIIARFMHRHLGLVYLPAEGGPFAASDSLCKLRLLVR